MRAVFELACDSVRRGNPLCCLGLRRGLKLFSFFVNIFLSNGILGSKFFSVGRRAALNLPTPPLIMHPYKSTWSILRCTPYESLQVHTFASQHAAESACNTLIRMSSSERDYWYEVAELIEIL